MSKNRNFEFKINASPLSMGEITKQLFNRNFQADVQFCVDGKIIYAHSLELMKRSVVFEQQLVGTMGDNKLIPINDFKYETFLEFIRFIYTDECEINVDNGIEILKLATKYKVISLENRVLRTDMTENNIKWILKCFEHCICDKYPLARNAFNDLLRINFKLCAEHEQFLSLHPDAIHELFKFDRIQKGVSEVYIFIALAKWIASYCRKYAILLRQGRQLFDKEMKKIRFATMSIAEIRECDKQYPGLLSERDFISIGRQTVFGACGSRTDLWISRRRDEYVWPIFYRFYQNTPKFQTIVSVSKDTNLYGIIIGIERRNLPIQIEIMETDVNTGAYRNLAFVESGPSFWDVLMIGLGDSLRLLKKCKYTISIKYLEVMSGNLHVLCRKQSTDVIIYDPDQTVKFINASDNMLEMFFKRPTDQIITNSVK